MNAETQPASGHQPIQKEALTVEETCVFLSAPRRTVERLTSEGLLPAFRLGQRAIRYRRSELIKFMEARQKEYRRGIEANRETAKAEASE